MRDSNSIKSSASLSRSAIAAAALLLSLSAPSARAQYFVLARTPGGSGPNTSGGAANYGNFWEDGITYGDSTGTTSAPGAPTQSGSRYRTSMTAGTGFDIQLMSDATPGAVYILDISVPNSNDSADILYDLASTNASLSATTTTAFRNAIGTSPNWAFVCYVTNNPGVVHPHVQFLYASGTISGTSRSYATVFRFRPAGCGAVNSPVLPGPLAAGQTNVLVTQVTNATAVTVYQDSGSGMVQIGKLTTGIVNGNNTVPTSALIKGAQVAATQTVGGQESCIPSSGTLAGGGANPRIRISATIRQDSNATGPIGAIGPSTSANLYWIKASGVITNGGCPLGGQVLRPSTNWQTIIFQATDPKFTMNGTPALPEPSQFGVLDGFALAIEDLTDTGPFQVYFDNVRNGSTTLQDFENSTPGTPDAYLLHPNWSGTTGGNLLTTPNSAVATGANAAYGTNAAVVAWQFNGTNANKWIRLLAGGTSAGAQVGTNFLMVDLTQPIAVDVLLTPVGQTNGHSVGLIDISGMSNQTVCPGSNATFRVAITPPAGSTPTYTYQWLMNGVPIPAATTASFTTNNVSSASAGTYAVVVSDGIGTNTVSATLAVTSSVQIDANLTSPQQVNVGDQIYISAAASAPATVCTPLPVTFQWLFNGTPIPGASGEVTQGVTCTKNNAQVADAGRYAFYVTSGYQTITSAVIKVYVVDNGSRVYGNGNGLLGLYYSNHLASAPFNPNNPVWTNTDPQIAFEWGAGAPDVNNSPSLVSTDRFTVRWLGQLQGEWAQTYTLYTTNDDGLRLWVDGKLVIDSWVDQGGQIEHSGTVALDTNLHPIVIEYYENAGNADVALFWDSASQVKEFIPMSQIYPATGYPATPSISLTSPANNAAFNNPATVSLAASVTSNLQGIEMVQFYYGSTPTLLAQVTNAPYSYSWANPAAGTYNVFARVLYDNASEHVDSSASTIHVTTTPPYVSSITGGAGSLSISGTGVLGQTFILQMASNLVSPISWKPIATNATGSGAFHFGITSGAVPSAFYRVQSK